MIELENPWLLLLSPLPWIVYRWLPAANVQSAALRVPFLHDLEQIEQAGNTIKQRSLLNAILLWAIWLVLLASICRPVVIGNPVQLPTEARDLMLAVDISGSMDESDMQLNNKAARRIDTVKYVVGEFTERRQGDRVGLILFADQAYLQTPLTYDTATVKQLLDEAQLGFAGKKTAIGDAIGLAVKRLVGRPAESRVLVLLTDGANNAGKVTPKDAASFAAENDITVHTIGIGADEIIERSFFGNTRRNPSRDLDERTLKAIAAQTGGQYFRARDVEQLNAIYLELDKLEPVEQDSESFRPKKQLFYWPMSVAFTLATLLLLINLLRQQR